MENHICQFLDIEYKGNNIYHEEGIDAHFYFNSQIGLKGHIAVTHSKFLG